MMWILVKIRDYILLSELSFCLLPKGCEVVNNLIEENVILPLITQPEMTMNLFKVNLFEISNKILFDFVLESNFDIKLIDHVCLMMGVTIKKECLYFLSQIVIVCSFLCLCFL